MPRHALVRAVLATALVAGLVATPGAARAGTATLPGVDVSHWNGPIDWTAVAADGVRFAVMKATEGRNYDDPTFAGHLARASANGIIAGGYHFARPDLTQGDARAEADHYLAVTALQPGEIVPILDIEQSGGLSVSQLQNWVRHWLERVTARTGVHPMIYSGPYFWRTYMGDTTWFADNGYDIYWIPHWGVASPATPADDWGGKSWTIWQWTNCWTVRGITGCVDGDVFKGTDLRRVTIPLIRVATTPGGRVRSDAGAIDCPITCDVITDPGAAVTLRAAPDVDASFVGWGGACADAGSATTCSLTALGRRSVKATFGYQLSIERDGPGNGTVTSDTGGIDCGAACARVLPYGTVVTLTAAPDPTAEFAGWGGDCQGTAPTCEVTMTGAHGVTATFEDQVAPTAAVSTPTALGDPVRVRFSEPVQGVSPQTLTLQVGTDGAGLSGRLVCHSAVGALADCATGSVSTALFRPASALVLGQHYMATVDPDGATPPIVDRAGNPVAMTAVPFRAPTTTGQAAPGTAYRWGAVADRRALGRSYLMDRRAGASVTYAFTGNAVTWYTAVGPGMGFARVLLDGRAVGTFDQYAGVFDTRVTRRFGSLGVGPHTITVTALGTHRRASSGSRVVVDGFATPRTTAPNPDPTGSWGATRDARASGGSFAIADTGGASARLTFRGTAVTWITATGPGMGRAAVYVDGTLRKTVDLSADTRSFGAPRRVGGLADRLHTVRVVVLGRPGALGTGTAVVVDGWSVT